MKLSTTLLAAIAHSTVAGKVTKTMIPPGLEPGTFRVLGERDNHYTTETLIIDCLFTILSLAQVVKSEAE